jgi:hypothetical protein
MKKGHSECKHDYRLDTDPDGFVTFYGGRRTNVRMTCSKCGKSYAKYNWTVDWIKKQKRQLWD